MVRYIIIIFWLLGGILPTRELYGNDFLPVNKAFIPQLHLINENRLRIDFQIAPGCYLYKNRIAITPDSLNVVLPPGNEKNDPHFGKILIYRHGLSFFITSTKIFKSDDLLQLTFQGCADKGVCYPPQTVTLKVGQQSAIMNNRLRVGSEAEMTASGWQNTSSHLFKGNVFLFYLAGIGLALTACMYPLIPIISNFIMGQNEASSSRGVWLSFLYVQAMAVTYAIAGILAGLSGLLLAVWMQQAWVLILLAVFFMMMALAMMGVFELQLSTRLQSWLISQTQRLPGGKASSAVVLGAVSALIVGPCVAPPLAAILVSISQEAAIWSGGLRLYIMALGIGTPLLLIALLGRHILPRLSPQIMRGVRQLFGLVLFGSALWVLSPLLSNTTVILLFTVLLLIASGLFAVVARGGNGISQWAFRLIALSCFLLGGAQLAGVWSGNQNIWRPLAAWFPTKTPRLSWSPVDSIAQVHAHLGQGKPVILDFYADWCISCKEMEYFTFTDVAVAKQIQDMILLKADMTKNTVEHRALLRAFGLYGPPAILFFDRRGQLIKTRVVGFQSASRFVQTLQQIRAVQ